MLSSFLLFAAIVVSNSVPNASFEAGITPHGVITSGLFGCDEFRPTVSLDETTAAHGKVSLRIDASRGGSYEFLTPDIELPEGGTRVTISAFVKADRPTEIRLGAFGFDRDLISGKELYTCPGKVIKASSDWNRYVLENTWVDGKCQRLCVKIMGEGPAVVWLDGIQFEIGGGDGKEFRPQADVEAVWSVDDHVFMKDFAGCAEGVAKLSIVDYAGGDVVQSTEKFQIVKNGIFTFDKTVKHNGREIRPYPFDYAVVPPVPEYRGAGFALGGNGLTGISVNRKTGDRVFTAPAGYSLSDYYRDIRRYGLRYVRFHDGNLQWRDMTSERGAYDWRVTDLVVKGCLKAGLEPMFLFASHGIFINSPWDDGRYAEWYVRKDAAVAGKGPFGHRRYFLPRMEDWTNFVATAVARYGDDIRYWEIVNEPNILMASAEAYADYSRAAYRTVKSIRSDAQVVGLCVTGDFGANPGSFLSKVEKTDAFESMDVASVHPYDSPLDYGKRDAEESLGEIRRTIDRFRPGLPLIQNELYYLYVEKPNGPWPVRNLIRRYAIDMGCGLRVSAPLAFDSHLGADAGHRKTLLPGRVSVHFMPNERFVASAVFASILEGGRPDGKLPGLPAGINGYLFRDRSNREVAMVWAKEERDEGVSVRLPSSAAAYDYFGNRMSGKTIGLTRDPIYVVGKGLPEGLAYEDLRTVYREIMTPYKYGVILEPEEGMMLDNPNVFRFGDRWWMIYIQFDRRGYETHLAESEDLVHWIRRGCIFERGAAGRWDQAQADGGPSLLDVRWDGSNTLRAFEGKYWMTYIGGAKEGYETDPLAIGVANALMPTNVWTRALGAPILSPIDFDARPFEKRTLYKSFVVDDPDRTLGARFIMYYNAKHEILPQFESIGMAVSDDMIRWRRYGEGPVVMNGVPGESFVISGDPMIRKVGDIWVMFYFGCGWREDMKGAFDTFAVSHDLVHWTKWQGKPLVAPSETWDAQHAHKPWVVNHNGVVYHYYCAVGDKGRVLALATSKDISCSAKVRCNQ